MKFRYLLFISFSFLFLTQAFSQKTVLDKLHGKWVATDNTNTRGSLEFLDATHIVVDIDGENLPRGLYTIDASKKPMWFDITIGNETNQRTLKCLLEFINNNTLKWQVFLDGNRPNNFKKTNADDTIVLKKKEL